MSQSEHFFSLQQTNRRENATGLVAGLIHIFSLLAAGCIMQLAALIYLETIGRPAGTLPDSLAGE